MWFQVQLTFELLILPTNNAGVYEVSHSTTNKLMPMQSVIMSDAIRSQVQFIAWVKQSSFSGAVGLRPPERISTM